jgi:hypothetical protein
MATASLALASAQLVAVAYSLITGHQQLVFASAGLVGAVASAVVAIRYSAREGVFSRYPAHLKKLAEDAKLREELIVVVMEIRQDSLFTESSPEHLQPYRHREELRALRDELDSFKFNIRRICNDIDESWCQIRTTGVIPQRMGAKAAQRPQPALDHKAEPNSVDRQDQKKWA